MDKKTIHKISQVLFSFLMIYSFAMEILTCTIGHGMMFLASSVWLLLSFGQIKNTPESRAEKTIKTIVKFFILNILLISCAVVSPIKYSFKYQYPFQMKYVNHYGYHCKHFPEKLPENAENYHFEFMPSVMQGTGLTSVSFAADAEYISEYVNKYKDCKSFTLDKYEEISNGNFICRSFSYQKNAEMSDMTAYIIYTNNDFNHFHVQCIIVNEKQSFIEFFDT